MCRYVNGERVDEADRGGVIFFGFAGKPAMTSAPIAACGSRSRMKLDAAGVVFGTIPAVHGGKNAVGRGLQRHVEVRREAIGGGEKIDKSGDVERLDGADAEALDSKCPQE